MDEEANVLTLVADLIESERTAAGSSRICFGSAVEVIGLIWTFYKTHSMKSYPRCFDSKQNSHRELLHEVAIAVTATLTPNAPGIR